MLSKFVTKRTKSISLNSEDPTISGGSQSYLIGLKWVFDKRFWEF